MTEREQMGRYDDSVPEWLCIHKCWLKSKNYKVIHKRPRNNNAGKALTIRMPDGQVLNFTCRADAAKEIGTHPANLTRKIRKGDSQFELYGKIYEVVA